MSDFVYDGPRVTTDCVVFGLDGSALKVLLIKRGIAPHAGRYALPGGFVRGDEGVDACARRELREETGLKDVFLEQLYTFGAPKRDPRGPIVSVAYYALTPVEEHDPSAATDAAAVSWHDATNPPRLAFDHGKILAMALERLRGKARYRPIGFELLPEQFTLSELRQLYETLLDRSLDKRNFRKKILAMDLLIDCNEIERDVAHRAARLYRFDEPSYKRLVKSGFNFEI